MILAPDELDSEGSVSPCAPGELTDEDLFAGDDEENVSAPDELCCRRLCLNGKDQAFSKQLAWLGTLAQNEYDAELYRKLRDINLESSNSRLPYSFCGTSVCRKAFQVLWQVSNTKIERYRKHIASKHPEPPQDLRKARVCVPSNDVKSQRAKICLHYLYMHVAEYMAEGDPELDEPEVVHVDAQFPHLPPKNLQLCPEPLLDHIGPSTSSVAMEPSRQAKALPPLSWVEIFTLFQSWLQERCITCSKLTLRREYDGGWTICMPFRRESTHSRCNACVEMALWRKRLPPGSPELDMVDFSFTAHIKDTMRDRDVQGRIWFRSGELLLLLEPPPDPDDDILCGSIDAMEQAKFAIPKEEPQYKSKVASAKWKPQLHVTGLIWSGACEVFYLSSSTLPKNANTQIGYLIDGFARARSTLNIRGRVLPLGLRLQSDNATGEMKNQTVMKFAALLTYIQLFRCSELVMFRAGHSHNPQDQRFSVAATAVSKLDGALQDLDDYARVLCDKMNPLPNLPRQEVIHMTAAWDWTKWFDVLEVNVKRAHRHSREERKW